MNKVSTRDSKFEILRILSMVMIVAYHISGSLNMLNLSAFDNAIIILFGSWGILGVNLFVLISCFFYFSKSDAPTEIELAKSIKLRIKKIVIQAFTYITAFTLFVPILTDIQLEYMLKVFVTRMTNDPLYADGYWFISAYIALQITLPYIKKLPVSKNLFIIDNILLFMSSQSNSKGFIPATVQFILIAVFLLHVMKIEKLNKFFHKYAGVGFFFVTFAMLAYTLTMYFLNKNEVFATGGLSGIIGYVLNVIVSHAVYFHRCSYLIVINSCFLFCWFKKLKAFNCNRVNGIASLMFGVYLFHQCPGYDIPNVTVEELSHYITNYSLLFGSAVLVILIGGIIVEYFRMNLFKVFNRYSISWND